MGEWRYSSTFHDLGTTCRYVVSYRFSLWGKSPRYPLDRKLGESQRKFVWTLWGRE
jgi:hypothetical protein